MRTTLVCIIVTVATSVFGADSDVKQVREHFKSDNYSVQWGTARTFDPGAELEIGDGSGHGFTLGWLRFRPEGGWVDVLSFRLDQGIHSTGKIASILGCPYSAAPVTTRRFSATWTSPPPWVWPQRTRIWHFECDCATSTNTSPTALQEKKGRRWPTYGVWGTGSRLKSQQFAAGRTQYKTYRPVADF